jgi:hypothetical protein
MDLARLANVFDIILSKMLNLGWETTTQFDDNVST